MRLAVMKCAQPTLPQPYTGNRPLPRQIINVKRELEEWLRSIICSVHFQTGNSNQKKPGKNPGHLQQLPYPTLSPCVRRWLLAWSEAAPAVPPGKSGINSFSMNSCSSLTRTCITSNEVRSPLPHARILTSHQSNPNDGQLWDRNLRQCMSGCSIRHLFQKLPRPPP